MASRAPWRPDYSNMADQVKKSKSGKSRNTINNLPNNSILAKIRGSSWPYDQHYMILSLMTFGYVVLPADTKSSCTDDAHLKEEIDFVRAKGKPVFDTIDDEKGLQWTSEHFNLTESFAESQPIPRDSTLLRCIRFMDGVEKLLGRKDLFKRNEISLTTLLSQAHAEMQKHHIDFAPISKKAKNESRNAASKIQKEKTKEDKKEPPRRDAKGKFTAAIDQSSSAEAKSVENLSEQKEAKSSGLEEYFQTSSEKGMTPLSFMHFPQGGQLILYPMSFDESRHYHLHHRGECIRRLFKAQVVQYMKMVDNLKNEMEAAKTGLNKEETTDQRKEEKPDGIVEEKSLIMVSETVWAKKFRATPLEIAKGETVVFRQDIIHQVCGSEAECFRHFLYLDLNDLEREDNAAYPIDIHLSQMVQEADLKAAGGCVHNKKRYVKEDEKRPKKRRLTTMQ